MEEICFVAAIERRGAERPLRDAAAALRGQLATQYGSSRARLGVHDLRIWLQDAGSELRMIECLAVERDAKETLTKLAAERSGLETYIREQFIQVFGQDPRARLPNVEHLLRWSRSDSSTSADLAYAIKVASEQSKEIREYASLLDGNRAFGEMLASSGLDSLSLWLQSIDADHAYLVVLLKGDSPETALAHPEASNDPISRWIREKALGVVTDERDLFDEKPGSELLFSWSAGLTAGLI